MVAEAVETTKAKAVSKNWVETEDEHAERLQVFYSRLPERLQWGNSIPLEKLHDYRHGVEASNRFCLAHKTRYSAVPKSFTRNGHCYFDEADAMHSLAVVLVDGIFRPLTFGQWLGCVRQRKIISNNEAADSTVYDWRKAKFPAYTLMRLDGGAKTPNGKVSTKTEEWGPDKSRLLLNPRFDAKQLHDGGKNVEVSLYDGEHLIAKRPEGAGYSGQFNSNMTSAEWGGIVFAACPPKVLGQHLVSRKLYLPQDLPFCGVDADELKASLPLARSVVPNDSTRPTLTHVLLSQNTQGLQVVATDTYRLSITNVPAEGTTDEVDLMVPPSALAAALENFSGSIILAWSEDRVWLSQDYTTGISIPREDGQYVNFRKVVPASSEVSTVFDAKELSAAIKELLAVAKEDANRIVFRAANGACKLSASTHDSHWWNEDTEKYETKTTTAEAAIPCEGEFEMAFNGRFILDFISKLKGEVVFECQGPLNSTVWRQGSTTYVLMPMQIM